MKFLIHRKVTISMIFIALTFMGYISYRHLLMELIPSTELPVVTVNAYSQTFYDPKYIENEIIIPLEGVAARTAGVKKISSTIFPRGGSIVVEFKPNTDMRTTGIRFTEEINKASLSLPDDVNTNVVMANTLGGNNQFMTLNVSGKGDADELRSYAEREIIETLKNINGVVGANIYGGRKAAIEVQLNDALSEALGINTYSVMQTIGNAGRERNFVGYTDDSNTNRTGVFVEGSYSNIDQIKNIVVAKGPVYLKDIATISYELSEPKNISRLNGKRTITIGISNESGANIVELSKRIQDELVKLNAKIAKDAVAITVQRNDAEKIEKNVNSIALQGIIGAVLAIIVLCFFVRNIYLAIAVSLAIPISIFSAFNFFYAYDITINSLTLIGMTIAIGMLLDNSIVVMENIYRLYNEGKRADKAVIEGVKQVWKPIIAATLTTITVFLPFIFTDNLVVKLIGRNVGVAIISTLGFSLLVALLLIPMITYVILKRKKSSQSVFSEKSGKKNIIVQKYIALLRYAMRNSARVITVTVILLLISFAWIFFQSSGGGKVIGGDQIGVYLRMAEGSTIESNDLAITEFEMRLDSIPERLETRSRFSEENANVTIKLKKGYDKRGGRKIGDIMEDVWKCVREIDGIINVHVYSGLSSGDSGNQGLEQSMFSSMGIGGEENELLVIGSDYEDMVRVGEDIRERISELDFIANASVSVQRGSPEADVDIDPVIGSSLGIGRQELTRGLSSLNKSSTNSSTQIEIEDELIDIIVKPEEKEDEELYDKLVSSEELSNIQILSRNKTFYRLGDIATITKDRSAGSGKIERVDRNRELKITYKFLQDNLPKEISNTYKEEVNQIIFDYPIPDGMAVESVDKDEYMNDMNFLIIAALIITYMILAIVFESLSLPVVMLFAIPFAAIGSFVALIITNNSIMSINTMIGLIILIGVVVNSGIILIDYTNLLRRQGFSRNRAIILSGVSRIKPIMITTITTIVALLPMALVSSEYAGAIGAPFAITVIGGLAFSSILTLVLIPILYLSLENVLSWYRSLPKWIYIIHGIIFAGVLAHIYLSDIGTFMKVLYILFVLSVIPSVTYLIQRSVRIANSKIIADDEPIIIEVRNLVKIYDRKRRLWNRSKPFKALKGISFTITNGMFGLLGSNGAGKSTFMKILTGIYEQSYGTIWVNGKNSLQYREELQSLIGFLPQEFGTYEDMRLWAFLDYQAILKGITNDSVRKQRLEYVLKAVHLYDKKDANISSFSGGMKQRVGIALILLNLPRILVVDEPTAGLDPRERIRFRNLLVELSKERIVIFSTHIIEDIASSCSQVVVINSGQLIYNGDPSEMIQFALGKVWSFNCTEEEFKNLDHRLIANHMRNNDNSVRIRYVSKDKPFEGAVRVEESLEDAYLCLLKEI